MICTHYITLAEFPQDPDRILFSDYPTTVTKKKLET